MERIKLEAQVREATGKGVARKLRSSGLLPAVIYGKVHEPQPLVVDPQDLKNKLAGNAIFDLNIEGHGRQTAMVKEIQKDPITGELKHVDFLHISMDEKIIVSVPVILIGDAPGIKEGGVLQQLLREIEVECLPLEIPEGIEVDISNLEIGNSLSVNDVEVTEGVDVITSLDEVIVTIALPTEAEEEEIEDKEEDILEPEVIGEETETETEE